MVVEKLLSSETSCNFEDKKIQQTDQLAVLQKIRLLTGVFIDLTFGVG